MGKKKEIKSKLNKPESKDTGLLKQNPDYTRLKKAADKLLEDYKQDEGLMESTLMDTGDIYEY